MNYFEFSAAQLHQKLVNKECSAVEITQSVLSRIDAVEDKVGAYLCITRDKALDAAKKVDDQLAAGEKIHPLAGIPIAIKDNICTRDVTTTCASKMLHNFVPPYNATVMDKLDAAGIVMPGKLNMDEFAMGSSCESSYFHPTRNPHNLDCVPGGSSGGSAAAVAAGEAILTLGSDTGGSIRQPSSLCGTIGLKPTYGSVSRYGLVAFAYSLDQIGPIGRTVEDVATLYGTICGYDPMEATSVKREYPDFASLLSGDVSGMRIGIPKEYFSDGVDDEVKASIHKALSELEARGAKLINISLPSTDYGLSAYYIISSAEASSNLARFDGVKYGYRAENYNSLTDMYEKTRSEGFGDEVKRRIMLGTFVLSSGYYDAYYNKAKLFQKAVSAEFAEAFNSCDVIATPTSPTVAFRLGENFGDPLKMYAADICTITINIAGLPAISIPCGQSKGLPIGLQFIGPKFGEQQLFRASRALEELRGGLCPIAAL